MRADTVSEVVFLLDTAYDRASWHGTNLRGSIRGVTPREAAWRPRPGRHNIWELVVHAAYWKYAAWRRLVGAKRGSFPLEGSNWWTRPSREPGAPTTWKADIALLEEMHRQLRKTVVALGAPDLERRVRGSRVSVRALVIGVAAHDLYHAGQIQLLKRLARA